METLDIGEKNMIWIARYELTCTSDLANSSVQPRVLKEIISRHFIPETVDYAFNWNRKKSKYWL